MDTFIGKPNLPDGKVTLGIIDGRTRKSILAALEESGVEIILSHKCDSLYEAVAYHPDMYMHHIESNLVVVAPNAPQQTVDTLKSFGFEVIKGRRVIKNKYPWDIAYNVARVGDYAFCNVEYTDEVLLSILQERGVYIVHIKQGYAKCSICVVNQRAIITSDEGITRALASYDFDLLKISPGNIELNGLPYGFIGGASGLISKDTVAFTGDVSLHPDFEKIKNFLQKHGKKYISLDNQKMMDVGTFIPLKEYCI